MTDDLTRELRRLDAQRDAALALADLWERQQAEYPRTEGGAYAAGAVRCCARELRAALSSPVLPSGGQS